jgi:hypothetical protein
MFTKLLHLVSREYCDSLGIKGKPADGIDTTAIAVVNALCLQMLACGFLQYVSSRRRIWQVKKFLLKVALRVRNNPHPTVSNMKRSCSYIRRCLDISWDGDMIREGGHLVPFRLFRFFLLKKDRSERIRILIQLSFAAKSFPRRTGFQKEVAEKAYMDSLCGPIGPEINEAIKCRVIKLSKKVLRRPMKAFINPASGSSCVEATRSEGGAAKLQSEELKSDNPKDLALKYLTCDIPPKDLLDFYCSKVRARSVWAMRDYKESYMRNLPVTLIPIPVLELGWKVRWVTRMPFAEQGIQSGMQKHSFGRLLKFCHGTRRGLEKADTLVSTIEHPANYPYVYSLDASKATDKMSRSSFEVCLNAIGAKMPNYHIRDRKMTIGGPMGTPINWVLLNILHECTASFSFSKFAYAICGDDFIGLGNDAEFSLYLEMNKSMGLLPKKETIIRSEIGGIFCERLYEVKVEEGHKVLRQAPIWGSTRMLVQNEVLFCTDVQKHVPGVLLIGDSTFEKLGLFPHMREALSPIVQLARRFGIDPYVPIMLGGLGIRPPDMDRLMPPRYRCLMTAIHNKVARPNVLMQNSASSPFSLYLHKMTSVIMKQIVWVYRPKNMREDDSYFERMGLIENYEPHLGQVLSILTMLAYADGYIPSKENVKRIDILKRLRFYSRYSHPHHVNRIPPLKWSYKDCYDFAGNLFPTRSSLEKANILFPLDEESP